MTRAREVHHKIENKWGEKQKNKKKALGGHGVQANEDTKWSSVTETLNTVVHRNT
jgi:hypothetical protein